MQEEIRFLLCPELVVARLFTETLADNECLLVTGAEQFSRYHGYASTFEWAGPYRDETVRDAWGRRQTVVVAMDALRLGGSKKQRAGQFHPRLLRRELNKAFCAFSTSDQHATPPCGRHCAVATGNWGCGAFGGDVRLKALLQVVCVCVCVCVCVFFVMFKHCTNLESFILAALAH